MQEPSNVDITELENPEETIYKSRASFAGAAGRLRINILENFLSYGSVTHLKTLRSSQKIIFLTKTPYVKT